MSILSLGSSPTTRWVFAMSMRTHYAFPDEIGKGRRNTYPDFPDPNDSYAVRIFPLYFDEGGNRDAYTTLVVEKPRIKISHETGKPEQRSRKLGWSGGRLEHGVDRLVYHDGKRENLQE